MDADEYIDLIMKNHVTAIVCLYDGFNNFSLTWARELPSLCLVSQATCGTEGLRLLGVSKCVSGSIMRILTLGACFNAAYSIHSCETDVRCNTLGVGKESAMDVQR